MAYITNLDIQERLGSATYIQLTDDDGDNVADVGVVDAARLAAEGEVDSYLKRRFTVPIDLSTHPGAAAVLASVTLDLVDHRLRSRRPPLSPEADRRRASAIDWLEKVSRGAIELPTAAPPARTGGIVAESRGAPRVVSREEMSDY